MGNSYLFEYLFSKVFVLKKPEESMDFRLRLGNGKQLTEEVLQ